MDAKVCTGSLLKVQSMARYSEQETSGIYELATQWKDECLLGEGSLLWPEEKVWTLPTLERFKACFIDKPDTSSDTFEQKFQKQLAPEPDTVTKLACELLLVYFLFPSSGSVKQSHKMRPY
jgi:5-methylcytosine-specific restriction protein B